MPANLTPVYKDAEERFRQAQSTEEKIAALEEMYAVIPKHKGTEKLQADIKRRLAKLRDETEQAKGPSKHATAYRIERGGTGQVALVGSPNTGKSSLLAALTHAHPAIGDFPFTTQVPEPGMMPWEDVQIQLVDLPPVTPDYLEPLLPGMLHRSDAAFLVADLASDDLLEETEAVVERLAQARVALVGALPQDSDIGTFSVPTLLGANKCDAEGAADRLELLRDLFPPERLPVLAVSTRTREGLEELRRAAWEMVGAMRVYGKPVAQKADMEKPFTIERGGTVADFAAAVHRDLPEKVKSAKVWGASARFPGQSVDKEHVLQDGDVVELHV